MTNSEILLAIIVALGFTAVIILLLRQRPDSHKDEVLQRLRILEEGLEADFTKATADMAARLEQVKGDLRLELADRLQGGFTQLRETVEKQLASGRSEQAQQLAQFAERQALGLTESRDDLARGLTQLSGTLQIKFAELAASQDQSARAARGELAQSLAASTKSLQERFQHFENSTAQSLENIRGKVDERLQAISDQVQAKLEKNIQEGFAHFQAVQEHLKAAEEQLRNVGVVGDSINQLNSLLKLPHLRGKFGEAELSRLLADFLPAAAFEEQAAIVPGSRELVDAVVKFPKFKLPIDSKFNREAILPLFETNDPTQLAAARVQLATAIKAQARSIAEKYIHPEHGTTDLALIFLPSETIYFEVIRDGELLACIHKYNVYPVSPNTLVISLRSIAMSMSHFEFAKNVEKTLEQIRQAQASFGFFQRKFEDVGKGLEKAQEAFQTASNHLNRYTNRVVQLTGEPVPELPATAAVSLPSPTE